MVVVATGLDEAVAQIRASGGYRSLVVGYRCDSVGLVFGLLVLVSTVVRSLPVTMTLFAMAALGIAVGVCLCWAGVIKLRVDRLMPHGGTDRHRGLMRGLWRDVIRPVQRNRHK
ncbi:hypothetical protein [Micromonospora sp. DT31]|uniref:hypothetical protein n=1 Tax=Micromonospora sp. DT31 TaxID=3393434 RepID=UPI003CF887AD